MAYSIVVDATHMGDAEALGIDADSRARGITPADLGAEHALAAARPAVRRSHAGLLELASRLAIWGLLIAAPFAAGDTRTGLLLLAALIAGYLFLWRSLVSRAWYHRGMGAACLFAASAISLEGLGWLSIPWWLGAAAIPIALLTDSGVRARTRARRPT